VQAKFLEEGYPLNQQQTMPTAGANVGRKTSVTEIHSSKSLTRKNQPASSPLVKAANGKAGAPAAADRYAQEQQLNYTGSYAALNNNNNRRRDNSREKRRYY
jgi:hypothetical protein